MKKVLLLLLLPFISAGQDVPAIGPLPETPIVTYANATATSVEFFWNEVIGADTYVISYATNFSMPKSISVGKRLRYPLNELSEKATINFTVIPIDKLGNPMHSGSTVYRFGGECSSSVVPPTVLNGVTVTATGTGSVETYLTSYSSCGIATTPPNSLWLGQIGSFSYTMTFSVPVNNLVIALTATGNTADEIFIFNTNGGVPTIQTTASCFTTVTGNQIASGNNSGMNGGGGIFTIQSPTNFTTLTISGPGGTAGSLLSLCSNSVAPIECNVSFAPTLSATSLTAICPATTVDLNSITASNQPTAAGVSMTWHSAIPVSQANSITGNLSAQPAGSTYYAAFFDSVNNCYSAPTAVNTTTAATIPVFAQVPPICSGQTLSALPTTSTNGIVGTWSPALNNSVTTTYTFTPTTSCATTVSMTISVTPSVIPVFDAIPAICAGDDAPELSLESNNGVTGTWSPAVNNTTTTTYIFTPDSGKCAATATAEIVVNPKPIVTITQACVGQNYVLTAVTDAEFASFEWLDENDFQIGAGISQTITTSGTYHVVVGTPNGCASRATLSVASIACGIQKGISPNGDTLNDFFDLTNFNVANLKVFNRYGMLVYDKANYTNQWHGKSNSGHELPDAVYYYHIELNDGNSKTGWVYINSKS